MKTSLECTYVRVNHLDDNFYRVPTIARKTMTLKQLRETLLYNSDGRIMACGEIWNIRAKHLGASVYQVWVERDAS